MSGSGTSFSPSATRRYSPRAGSALELGSACGRRCLQLGKQDNCRVAVSLSLANHHGSLPDRNIVGSDGEFGTHVIAHGPTNHLAGEQVEDHGQVEPALAGRNVGDIGQRDLIGLVGDKILIQQVCRHREGMLAVGCAHTISGAAPEPEDRAGA
jgi:hypothetical protein